MTSQQLARSLANVLMKFIGNSYICDIRNVFKMGLKR